MRNHLRSGKLLRFERDQIAMYRLGIAKCICRNCGSGGRLIAVVNVVNLSYVRNVGNVYLTNIGDIDLPQIDIVVVVPGKERLPRTERKPAHDATNSEAHRKSCTT